MNSKTNLGSTQKNNNNEQPDHPTNQRFAAESTNPFRKNERMVNSNSDSNSMPHEESWSSDIIPSNAAKIKVIGQFS
jgi:cell division protein FtsZ